MKFLKTIRRVTIVVCIMSINPVCAEDNPPSYNYMSYEELVELAYSDSEPKTNSASDNQRIEIIKSEAEELGISNAYAATLQQFSLALDKNSELFDWLLPFEYLSRIAGDLNVSEARFIRPGIVDEANNSSQLHSATGEKIIKQENKTYIIREQPQPILRPPHWSDYLYDKNIINIHEISPELLPRNKLEMKAYMDGLKTGTEMGYDQAEKEIQRRLIDAFRDCIGMARYINLTDNGTLEKPNVVVENRGASVKGDTLSIGTKYIYLNGDAKWNGDIFKIKSPFTDTRGSVRQEIRAMISNGTLSEKDIEDAKIKIQNQ